ncbi:MAG: hypothetical protein FWE10_01795 [Rikenellaceae bacterium]|nr:hypothetical protein [Rikenellaceae bacterium]MCL2692532.1 hypothetical protein [Rikenellaceae bacterium]
MNWNDICRDVAAVGEIARGWQRTGAVSAIEKDLVLEKLRRVYEAVMFADDVEISETEVPAPPILVAPVAPVVEPAAPIVSAPAPATEPVLAPEPVSVPPTPAPIPVEPEPQADKAKIDIKALRSLYEDAAVAPPSAKPAAPSPTLTHETHRTIADAYSAAAAHDIASAIGHGPLASLRNGIGVNDRFLMIRDVFDGDGDLYERTIDYFESFTDLDDAMIYIHENFSRNSGSEGVRMLVDLLERKLT